MIFLKFLCISHVKPVFSLDCLIRKMFDLLLRNYYIAERERKRKRERGVLVKKDKLWRYWLEKKLPPFT